VRGGCGGVGLWVLGCGLGGWVERWLFGGVTRPRTGETTDGSPPPGAGPTAVLTGGPKNPEELEESRRKTKRRSTSLLRRSELPSEEWSL